MKSTDFSDKCCVAAALLGGGMCSKRCSDTKNSNSNTLSLLTEAVFKNS